MLSGDDLEAFGYYDMVDAYPPEKKTYMEMVEEFRTTMGQEKDPVMSLKLVLEEYCEFWDLAEEEHRGYKPLDKVSTLKELADLVYVIFGYANAMGWDLDKAVCRVHENNMERCVWPDGQVRKREDGKVLKNPAAKKVDLSDLV